jgi:coenzyme Q-binding protein COQ10
MTMTINHNKLVIVACFVISETSTPHHNVHNNMLKSLLTPVTKRHVERKILRTPPLHLFRIIQDVDQYSKFLPLCTYSRIVRQSPDGRSFDGKLKVGIPPLFVEEYVSRVEVIPERLMIEATSIESKLFDSLKSRWTVGEVELSNEVCCNVEFEVELTVSDPIIVRALDKVLQTVAGRQVEAFEKRCHQVPIPKDILDAGGRLPPRQ